MLRQHLKLAQNARQLTIALAGKEERYLVRRHHLDLADVLIVLLPVWIDLDQFLERPLHILGRHRLAVLPFSLRIDLEGRRGDVWREGEGARDQGKRRAGIAERWG